MDFSLDEDLSLELDFSLDEDFSLELELSEDPLVDEPLLELDDDFLPDSRLSVR